jgi:predicted trehalose synthase
VLELPPGLGDWISGQRWFAGKRRRIVAVEAEDRVALGPGWLWIVGVRLDDGTLDRYAVPLLDGPAIRDALDDPGFCGGLLDLIARQAQVPGERGEVVASRTRAFAADQGRAPGRRLLGEQSNTSVVFGASLILKHFRRLAVGPNPDVEVTRFLTERTDFRHTPRLAGSLEYRDAQGVAALAMAQELVPGEDGWRWLLGRLAANDEALAPLRGLGRRTAELHRALGSDAGDAAFAPEPITATDVEAWTAAVQRQLDAARAALGAARAEAIPARVDGAGLGALRGAVKQRHHGDFHLGQTLVEDGQARIIDFEGEPLRPLAERRRKHTPLRDVAGLLRSLGYAAASAPAPTGWEERARDAFLDGYRDAAAGAPFLPRGTADLARVVAVLEVEKAAYEIVYEADHRPDWITIPLGGLVRAARAVAAPG